MLGYIVRKFKKRSDGDKRYCRIIRDIFGFRPDNLELYKLALIHRSASLAMPDGAPMNNERLEFLGDAVLESIVSDYVFIEYPYGDEGFLTQLRSKIVNRSTLNDLCVKIGLSDYIISQPGNYTQKHLHGDALEAMIGAIYLDKGYDFANRLLINHLFADYLDLDSITEIETDYKSRLIEWCQKSKHSIRFDTCPAEDSALQNPKFKSVVVIKGMEMGYGFGPTKKEAEQNAAFSVSQYTSMAVGDSFLELVDKATQEADRNRDKATGQPVEKQSEADGRDKKAAVTDPGAAAKPKQEPSAKQDKEVVSERDATGIPQTEPKPESDD